ncbi:DUF3768 domain-containing protein [Ruegeria sp. Ofav3-42]|uniref:DUF3768 domain-containing protein n=1 Tax=Ruegeria sp. Ofav3-42 TaxID=2917759 RepID=UPI001EF5D562|nr:DUF3768 domain-containing protein [Ruegeria sp. Ofav3-42]MCG7520556.1 DUF3768 domain-containing protein [Ruegeria sp. Ofav3-42]
MTDSTLSTRVKFTAGMSRTQKIQILNDHFRKTGEGGIVMISMGMHLLGRATVDTIMKQIGGEAGDKSYVPDDEHDYGTIEVNNRTVHWEIESYNKDLDDFSPDATDPKKTTRFMTVLLSTEY